MKMTRKIFPALVMLLVSAIMLSTASFAWFASNAQVSATNMNVKVKSLANFLQISTSAQGDYDDSAEATNGKDAAVELNLVHAVLGSAGKGPDFEWKVGSSDDPTSANSNQTLDDLTQQMIDDNGDYYLENTFYVRMAEGSHGSVENLTIEKVTVYGTTSLANALRVLVVGADGAQIWSNRDDLVSGSEHVLATVPAYQDAGANEQDGAEIKVYIYFDGEDEDSRTNNTLDLTALNVSVTFSATDPDSN